MVVGIALWRRPLDVVIIFLAHVELASDNRLYALVVCRIHKVHRSKDVSVVGHGDGRHAQLFYALAKLFNVAGAVE